MSEGLTTQQLIAATGSSTNQVQVGLTWVRDVAAILANPPSVTPTAAN